MPTVLLVCFAVIGLIVACDAIRTLYPRFISGRWIKVVAQVAYADAKHQDDGGYTAWLVYDYTYQGKKYRSPITHVDWPICNAEDATAFEQIWNRSRSRDIWVNDKLPHLSLASLDKWQLSAFAFFAGLLVCGVSLYLLS